MPNSVFPVLQTALLALFFTLRSIPVAAALWSAAVFTLGYVGAALCSSDAPVSGIIEVAIYKGQLVFFAATLAVDIGIQKCLHHNKIGKDRTILENLAFTLITLIIFTAGILLFAHIDGLIKLYDINPIMNYLVIGWTTLFILTRGHSYWCDIQTRQHSLYQPNIRKI